MNENYSSAAASLSCLFPSIEEVHRFEYEGSSVTCPHPSQDSVGISCYFEDFYAVAEGNALTIFQFTDKDGDAISDIIAEIEFDNVLKFLQWDISGRCLALSDDQGIIHLVNRNGLLLFSKQVFSVATGVSIRGLQFVGDQPSSQSLCAVLSNGSFLAIRELDMLRLSQLNESQLNMIPQFLKQAKFLSIKLLESGEIILSKLSVIKEVVTVVIVDENSDLVIYEIPLISDTTVKEVQGFTPKALIDKKIVDFRFLESGFLSLLVLTSSGRLLVGSIGEEEDEETDTEVERWTNFHLDNNQSSILSLYSPSLFSKEERDEGNLRSVWQLLLQQRTVDGSKRLFLFSVVSQIHDRIPFFIVLPHGCEENVLPVTPFLPSNCVGNQIILGLLDSTIVVYSFSRISVQFTSAMRNNTTDEVSLSSNTSFDAFLQVFIAFLFRAIIESDISEINRMSQACLDRLFPSEIVLSLGLLLDCCGDNIDDSFYLQCLSLMVSVLHQQTKQLRDIGLTACQTIANKWNHQYLLAKRFHRHFSYVDKYPYQITNLLFPLDVKGFIEVLLLKGKINEVLFLYEHLIGFAFPNNMTSLISSVPKNSPIDLLTDLFVYYIETEREKRFNALAAVKSNNQDYLTKILVITTELFQRGRDQSLAVDDNEAVITKAFHTCSQLLQVCKATIIMPAQEIGTAFDENVENNQTQSIQRLVSKLMQFEEYLKIVLLSRSILKIPYSLEEVMASGLKGLLFSCMNQLSVENLSDFIRGPLTEFLTHFPSDNEVSSLLNDWVEMSIQDYLLTSSSFLESGEDEDEKDHSEEDVHEKRNLEKFQQCLEALLRLTTVLSCLQDRWKGTSLLMKVLNIPSIELLCIQDTSGRLISDLMELGKSLSEKVNGAVYDQLSEAIRLFRMKCIALRYQIQSFDIKDRDHLIFVISIILNSNHRNKVEDAFCFAIDESSSVRIDCKPALIRILIHFLQTTDFNTESTESSLITDYDERLKNLVEKIPAFMVTIILEDVLSFCVDEVNDSCDNNKLIMDEWEGDDDKERKKITLQRYSKGCIKLLEYYQDITTASSKTINQNVLARTQHPAQSSLNPADGMIPTNGNVNVKSVHKSSLLTDSRLLQGLKNIFQLQSAFNVYLNLQNMKSSADCKKLIENLAADIVTRWKKANQPTGSNSKTGNEWDVNQLVNECFSLKKICSILDASCQIYVFHIAKSLIGLGKKMQALEFLRLNAEELLSNAAASGESWSITSSSQSRNNGGHYSSSEDGQKKSNIQNWNLMVDGANLLCYSALKNERSTKTYGYYAQSSSSSGAGNDDKAFEIDAYSLSQLLLRNSILHCDNSVLPRALDALTLTDTVLTVYDRIEKDLSSASSVAASATTVANSSSINSDATTMVITIGDNVFNKDGLLMSEDSIRSALTQYCIQEMKRREVSYEAVAPSSSSASESTKKNSKSTTASASSISTGPSTIDVENVISVLQKYENHLIAMQILFRSWSSSSAKISFLRSSLTSLCRKVLTYHNIDTTFAVACLSALPIDVIVKELKAAVPTIQSDFSRLHTVALIGEEIAYLCDQESLLLLFQSLQTNAKWWYLLSNIGINIDLKLFQHSDDTLREQYIESLIPEILKRNNYQLDLLMDYCQSFDLKPEKACLAYLELVFLDPTVSFQPASSSVVAASTTSNSGGRASYVSSSASSLPSSSWISKVKAITNGIHENIIRNYLFKILLKMNPFEYDKISFLCQWLMEITPADAVSSCTSQASSVVDREVKGQTIYEVENEDEGELGGGLLDNSVILGSLNSSIVTTSTISSTGSDGGNGPRKSLLYWLNNYHVIIDIINLLNSIHLPSPMVQKVRKLPQIDRIYKKYEGSGSSSPLLVLGAASRSNAYDYRFPLWILLLNPYLLFEPILDDVITVFQEKLSLLLMLLQLNIEDFTVKSIYAYYITLLQQPIYLNQTEKVLEVIQQTIQEKLGGKSLLCQIKVWELIYDKEVQPGQGNSKQIAILALEKILALFEQDKKYSSLLGNDGQTGGNQHQITMSTLENSFQEKLKKLRIEFILIRLFQLLQSKSHINDPQKLVASSLSLELKEVSSWLELFIQYPKEMIKAILALFIEFFWQTIVMKSTNPSGQSTSADSLDMMLGYSLNHLVLQFFRSHQLLDDFLLLAHYCAQLNSSNNNIDNSGGASGGQQFLQAVLISLMNHYLTEMHVTFNSSTSTITTTSTAGNNSTSSAPSSGMNANSTGKPSASASASLWEFSDSLLGGITGSKAEHRRHEDFFLAFAINLLTLFTSASSTSNSSGEERLHTLQYLDSIMRANNGTKSMRRFNTRSRLRASVALHFLASTTNSSSSLNSSSLSCYSFTETERLVLEKSDVFHHVSYYFLLAEIHEIRLSTSEDMILHCLSFTLTPSTSTQEIQLLQDSTDAAAIGSRNLRRESYDHLKSVISTWMHDEGRLIDVMELCCDLFHLFFFYSTTTFASSSRVAIKMVLSLDDASLVLKMVQTMLQHQHYRIIYRFLILLSRQRQYMMLYEHLLYQADVNRAIVEALFTMLLSLLDKANQQVAKNVREDEDNKPFVMTSFIFGELKRISVISNELQALHHEHHADDDVHSLTKDKKMMGLEEDQDKENQTRHLANSTSRAIDSSNPQKDRGAPAAITALSNKEIAILKSIYSPSIACIHYPLPRSSVSSGGSQQTALLLLTKEVSGLLCAFLEAYLFMHGVRSSPSMLSKYEDVVTQLDQLAANTSFASQWWKEVADQWHAEELVTLVEKVKGK